MNFVNDSTNLSIEDPDRYFPEDLEAIDHAAAIIWSQAPAAMTKGAAVRIASKVYDGLRQFRADQVRRPGAHPMSEARGTVLRPASAGFDAITEYYKRPDKSSYQTGIACPKCGREMTWGHARGAGVVAICDGDDQRAHGYVLVDRTGKTV